MAFVDFNYSFVVAEMGTQGKISDGGVYRSSEFNKALQSGSLNIPPPRPLPRNSDTFWEDQLEHELPMVFVGEYTLHEALL